MEYMSDSYRRSNGRILTTTDVFKYSKYKVKENTTYLRCVLSKNGCKGKAKLKLETDLIYPSSLHNHGIDKYNSGVYELKTKCKKRAQTTQDNLRKIFDDETRTSLLASEISFNECESSMYCSRRRLQPKVPLTAIEFSVMLPESTFATHHKFTVTATNHTAVIFYSERMKSYLSEISKIQSDGTFYTVPTQFSQLWTIFVVIDRHALPGIHCLMTSKDQELYTAILAKIHSLVPEFIPEISISYWEPAPRNAFKEVYPTIQNQGCWFHFTQRIWAKTQKLGLVHSFHDNPETAKFI